MKKRKRMSSAPWDTAAGAGGGAKSAWAFAAVSAGVSTGAAP